MRTCSGFVLILAALAGPALADIDGDIRQVLQRQQDAWNRGDLKAFMQAYENAESTMFVGAAGVTRGYDPVLKNYVKRYPTRDAMGTLTYSNIEVHLMGNDHAWVLGRFHLKRTAAGGGDKSGIYTLVFKRTTTGWKVVLDHTSSQ